MAHSAQHRGDRDRSAWLAFHDGLGHASGGKLLRQVALRLRASLRPADSVARFGGDEFAILLEDVSVEETQETADRILEVLKLPVAIGEARFGVAVSIGLAFASPESTVEELLRDADIAVCGAKANGRGCALVFDAIRGISHDPFLHPGPPIFDHFAVNSGGPGWASGRSGMAGLSGSCGRRSGRSNRMNRSVTTAWARSCRGCG